MAKETRRKRKESSDVDLLWIDYPRLSLFHLDDHDDFRITLMALEIERKFLVLDDTYKHEAFSKSHIRQGYICSERGKTVRIRIRQSEELFAPYQRKEQAFITIKGPSLDGGLSRYEFEQEIPLDDAERLMSLCEPGVIDKIRWLVKYEGHIFEVDEFLGENSGLVMAEVELTSRTEEAVLPHFIGEEVTGDRRYYNSQLRRCPYTTWKG